jgi:hypothetical protein
MPYLSKDEGSKIVKLILAGMLSFLLLVVYVAYSSYQGRVDTVTAQRAGCERGKLDRQANADFQRAHKKYIDKVVLAKSVEEDVKRAAREAVLTYNRTSAELTERAQIDCAEAFPKASLIP